VYSELRRCSVGELLCQDLVSTYAVTVTISMPSDSEVDLDL
jgi:hypothetical protein